MAKYDNVDEEMTVDITLENDEVVTCAVITILEVEGKDYIVLLPLDEDGNNDDGEVWFYGYSENPNDPNEEPELSYIEDDDEYEAVADLFDEYLNNFEFDELNKKKKGAISPFFIRKTPHKYQIFLQYHLSKLSA